MENEIRKSYFIDYDNLIGYAEMEKEENSVENSNEKERRNMTEQELHPVSLESVRHSHSEQCAAFTGCI